MFNFFTFIFKHYENEFVQAGGESHKLNTAPINKESLFGPDSNGEQEKKHGQKEGDDAESAAIITAIEEATKDQPESKNGNEKKEE